MNKVQTCAGRIYNAECNGCILRDRYSTKVLSFYNPCPFKAVRVTESNTTNTNSDLLDTVVTTILVDTIIDSISSSSSSDSSSSDFSGGGGDFGGGGASGDY